MSYDFDFIIIGSGFGGSVSAMRLSEKRYRVAVIEQGRRYKPSDFPKTNWDLPKYLWAPLLRCFGIQRISPFQHALVLSGAGVGGGSLVYANTLLRPDRRFFEAASWAHLADWESELLPHYETAERMLGVTENPHLTFVDEALKSVAQEMGRSDTFRPSRVGIYFGKSGQTARDPYFMGEGPDRTGCTFCGGCMVGCRYGAKNTLDQNYLYFAEKWGTQIIPETTVYRITPHRSGYRVDTRSSTKWPWRTSYRSWTARKVVLAAGVLGTNRLLLTCRDRYKSLPLISEKLGQEVRTNSEALVGITQRKQHINNDYSTGIAISSVFHPDEHTHIEPVRYSRGSSFMRLLAAPMTDAHPKVSRPLLFFFTLILHPLDSLSLLFAKRWAERSTILLVMQNLDNHLRLVLGRFGLRTALDSSSGKIPSYIPIGHRAARKLAKKLDAIPQSAINEVLLNIPTTAHILGGCPIGKDSSEGVIGPDHQVHHYPGLYVCDGSAIPANLGVNPSLTITAMTERAMSFFPFNSGDPPSGEPEKNPSKSDRTDYSGRSSRQTDD